MKNTVLFCLLLSLISCSPFHSPTASESEILRKEVHPGKIAVLFDELLASGRGLTVYASPKGPEALEFLTYIIPLLHEQEKLSIRLWFLRNSSDDDIKRFLQGKEDAPDAAELLRRADPILCGFESYSSFLEKLKSFYTDLDDPESMMITSSDEAILDFRLYNGQFLPAGERSVYLVHSPLPVRHHWELPFEGLLYSMMIHEWPLHEYGAVSISENYLGSLFLTSQDAHDKYMASDRIDGLFLMSYPRDYIPMKRIEGFVSEENVADVLDFFPRQLIREKTKPASYLVNSKIDSRHNRAVRKLKRLYNAVKEKVPGYNESES